ncbi:MAG: hypothetical protein AAF483_27680, partial [Planctomycetota bacterium]
QNPNVNLTGEGPYAITPLELATQKEQFEIAQRLVAAGATPRKHVAATPREPILVAESTFNANSSIRPAKPSYAPQGVGLTPSSISATVQVGSGDSSGDLDYVARMERQLELVDETVRKLRGETHAAWFNEQSRLLEDALGIRSKPILKRGMHAFNRVPLQELANRESLSVREYMVLVHDTMHNSGVTLFADQNLFAADDVRLILAPSTKLTEIVAATNVDDSHQESAQELALGLEELQREFPFRVLECGQEGIWGDLIEKVDPQHAYDYYLPLANRLLDVHPQYADQLKALHCRPLEADDQYLVQSEVAETGGFYLGWGS